MRRVGWAYAAFLALGAAAVARQGDNNEARRKELKDTDLVGKWVYDDIGAGYAEAKKSGKPMLVVFR